jgi:hypothetical protein
MCVLVVPLPLLDIYRCPDSVGVHRYVLVVLVVSLGTRCVGADVDSFGHRGLFGGGGDKRWDPIHS